MSNLDRFRNNLETLINMGERLGMSMNRECYKKEYDTALKEQFGDKAKEVIRNLPSFKNKYQSWYSEALAVIKQVLPDRLADFSRHYEKPKGRKDITWDNYHIENYLQGLRVTRGLIEEVVVDAKAAIPRFQQQLAILQSAKQRFDSSLFDIKAIVQADIFYL